MLNKYIVLRDMTVSKVMVWSWVQILELSFLYSDIACVIPLER